MTASITNRQGEYPFSLEPADRGPLIRALAHHAAFEDASPAIRRSLMFDAGLDNILASFDFSGGPEAVAGNLIRFLAGDRSFLGMLLQAMRSWSGTLPAQASVINDIISRYGFAPFSSPSPTSVPVVQPRFVSGLSQDNKQGLEQVLNSYSNFLDIETLTGAIYCAQAVARIEWRGGSAIGTGFLIGPDLLLTNKHVLPNSERLESVAACFGYVADATGKPTSQGIPFDFDQEFYYDSPVVALDYALVRLTKQPLREIAVPSATVAQMSFRDLIQSRQHRGYLQICPRRIGHNERVNIIQHPGGEPMKVILTQNRVVGDMMETRVKYTADTDEGSSGSPVFGETWEVIALHSRAEGPTTSSQPLEQGKRAGLTINAGIPILTILADLRRQAADPQNVKLAEALTSFSIKEV